MPPGQERTAARLANCDAQLLSPLVSQPFSMLSTSSCRAQPKSAIRQRSSIMASPRLMTRLLMHSNRACRLGSGWHAGLQHKALRKLHRWDPGRQLACVSQLCSFRAVLVPRLSCCEGRPAAMPAAHTTSTSPGSSADRPSPCLKSIPDVENPKQTLNRSTWPHFITAAVALVGRQGVCQHSTLPVHAGQTFMPVASGTTSQGGGLSTS